MPPNVGEALAIIQSDINFDPRHVQKRDGEPAADWEMLPEFPTPEEIMSPDASTDNLPWFPVKHSWKSKAQYLEALYKILRFEAVEGLRYSVNSFRATPNMHDNDDTCVYTKVCLRCPCSLSFHPPPSTKRRPHFHLHLTYHLHQ